MKDCSEHLSMKTEGLPDSTFYVSSSKWILGLADQDSTTTQTMSFNSAQQRRSMDSNTPPPRSKSDSAQKVSTGYESRSETESLPLQSTYNWELEVERIADGECVYTRLDLDGKTVGTLRLPNLEVVKWLRERLSRKS